MACLFRMMSWVWMLSVLVTSWSFLLRSPSKIPDLAGSYLDNTKAAPATKVHWVFLTTCERQLWRTTIEDKDWDKNGTLVHNTETAAVIGANRLVKLARHIRSWRWSDNAYIDGESLLSLEEVSMG